MTNEEEIWCEHIHNWGDAFYYVDSRNPFPVLTIGKSKTTVNKEWKVCPVCQKLAPNLQEKNKEDCNVVY